MSAITIVAELICIAAWIYFGGYLGVWLDERGWPPIVTLAILAAVSIAGTLAILAAAGHLEVAL